MMCFLEKTVVNFFHNVCFGQLIKLNSGIAFFRCKGMMRMLGNHQVNISFFI